MVGPDGEAKVTPHRQGLRTGRMDINAQLSGIGPRNSSRSFQIDCDLKIIIEEAVRVIKEFRCMIIYQSAEIVGLRLSRNPSIKNKYVYIFEYSIKATCI